MMRDEMFDVFLITVQVTERITMPQSKAEWFNGAIKTYQSEKARNVARSAQDRQRVGGGAQANIPNHKFARVRAEPFDQCELFDVKRLGLGDRADHRMECFAMSQRADAVHTVDEFDQLVPSRCSHAAQFEPAGRRNASHFLAMTRPMRESMALEEWGVAKHAPYFAKYGEV